MCPPWECQAVPLLFADMIHHRGTGHNTRPFRREMTGAKSPPGGEPARTDSVPPAGDRRKWQRTGEMYILRKIGKCRMIRKNQPPFLRKEESRSVPYPIVLESERNAEENDAFYTTGCTGGDSSGSVFRRGSVWGSRMGFSPGRRGRQLCRRGSRGGEAFRRGSRRRLGNCQGGTSRRGAEHGCLRLPEGSHRRLVDPPGVARSRRPARPCCPSIHERPFVAGFQRTPGFPAPEGRTGGFSQGISEKVSSKSPFDLVK